jgi:hypothetical protein
MGSENTSEAGGAQVSGASGTFGRNGTTVAVRRVFVCQCGRPIFFRNSACIACGTPLGYDPQTAHLLPLEPAEVPAETESEESESQESESQGQHREQQQVQSPDASAVGIEADSSTQMQSQSQSQSQLQPQTNANIQTQATARDQTPDGIESEVEPDFAPDDEAADESAESLSDEQMDDAGPEATAEAIVEAISEPIFEPISEAAPEPAWKLFGSPDDSDIFARCANYTSAAPCNWLVAWNEFSAGQPMCRSCRLNRIIPDLSRPESAELWGHVEQAKRRLVSSLIGLRLPVLARVSEDLHCGLAFDLLRGPAGGPAIMTGHRDGIITLNVDEADDATRERLRAKLQEPYRTLLGHLRHEIGHYYWWRLVDGGAWMDAFREIFGDERQPYQAALAQHYRSGPRADWRLAHVSAYASSHPWEDWAETWAHYLHMVDTLDTASSFGLDSHTADLQYDRFTRAALWSPAADGADEFLHFVNAWVELTGVLNELSRSMGQPDLYPFVLPAAAIAKLQLVHLVATTDGPPVVPASIETPDEDSSSTRESAVP